jgi:hypothetical protein
MFTNDRQARVLVPAERERVVGWVARCRKGRAASVSLAPSGRLLRHGRVSHKGGAVREALETSGMPQNFIECQRDQAFLMPPDLRDWLPGDHLVWTIVDAVEEMDLAAFYGEYRSDGHGRAAYEPSRTSPFASSR